MNRTVQRSRLILNLDQSGQVLIVILLVIVVVLTIGLSIAGSSIKNVQDTAVIEESNRAFSAAEAGVEKALLQIEEGTPAPTFAAQSLTGGSEIKDVQTVERAALQLSRLEADSVAQLDLECPSCGTGTITVSWDPNSSIVISIIRNNAGTYEVERFAYNCDFNPTNNFTNVSSGAGSQCSRNVNIDGATDLVMRIRALYQDTSITVEPNAGTSIPVQSTVVTSTGQSGEAERTVQVERSLPVPPSILDYVLFSASGSLSK